MLLWRHQLLLRWSGWEAKVLWSSKWMMPLERNWNLWWAEVGNSQNLCHLAQFAVGMCDFADIENFCRGSAGVFWGGRGGGGPVCVWCFGGADFYDQRWAMYESSSVLQDALANLFFYIIHLYTKWPSDCRDKYDAYIQNSHRIQTLDTPSDTMTCMLCTWHTR